MSERPKEHDWKSCVPRKGTEGSNPSLCATKKKDGQEGSPFFVLRKRLNHARRQGRAKSGRSARASVHASGLCPRRSAEGAPSGFRLNISLRRLPLSDRRRVFACCESGYERQSALRMSRRALLIGFASRIKAAFGVTRGDGRAAAAESLRIYAKKTKISLAFHKTLAV